MLIKIKVVVKDPSNSKKFIGDILKINLKRLFRIKSKKVIFQKKIRRKFTTLKSPHVHKDAQTSFEDVSYSFVFLLNLDQLSKFLSYYKKSICRLISDARIKITLKILNKNVFLEKKGVIKRLICPTKTQKLSNYLIELGFFGKTSFLYN